MSASPCPDSLTSCNVLLVGAGPIGIECAIALREAGVEYYHVERGNLAATIEWYAPGTTFFSSSDRIALAGVPLYTAHQAKATREEYLLYLRSLTAQFHLPIELQTEVSAIEKRGEIFRVTLKRGEREQLLDAKRVILAIGDMHHPRLLGVPGESLPHVSHYLREPHSYFHQDIVVVGGKNSAVEATIRLEHVGARVTLVYRGAALDQKRIKSWLYPELLYLVRNKKITLHLETEVEEIHPGEIALLSKNDEDFGAERILCKADKVLLLTGYEQEKTLFQTVGLALEGEGRKPVLREDTMESSVQGVYVIGTAMAGTQSGGVKEFIETSHVHVERVVEAISGRKPTHACRTVDLGFLEN